MRRWHSHSRAVAPAAALVALAACWLVGCVSGRASRPATADGASGATIAPPKPQGQAAPAPQVPAQKPHEPMTRLRQAARAIAAELATTVPAGATLAVLPLPNASGGVLNLGHAAAHALRVALGERGYRLVDRERINAVLAERRVHLAGLQKGVSTDLAGRITGADYLVTGSLTVAGDSVRLWAEAIRVRDGAVAGLASIQNLPVTGLEERVFYVRRPEGKPRPSAPPPALPPLTLTHRLVTPRDASGRERALHDGDIVRTDDRFRLAMTPNSDCHLYVFLKDSAGRATVLLPHPKIPQSNMVRGEVTYEIPSGTRWYTFDDTPGTETLYLVASYRPLGDLADLAAALGKADRQENPQAAAALLEQTVRRHANGMAADRAQRYVPKGYQVIQPAPQRNRAQPEKSTGHAVVVRVVRLRHLAEK